MRCFYNKLKKRKGPNPAKVAAARRMLTIIFRMLKENRPFWDCFDFCSFSFNFNPLKGKKGRREPGLKNVFHFFPLIKYAGLTLL